MRAMKAFLGLVLGGAIGLAVGFVVYMVAREMVLPTSLWSSDPVMWTIILVVAGVLAVGGAKSGWDASPSGAILLKTLVGLGIGTIAGALLALALSVAAAIVFRISQMEGAYAMGVAFTIMPLGAFIGGIVGAVWMGWRAKRRNSAPKQPWGRTSVPE